MRHGGSGASSASLAMRRRSGFVGRSAGTPQANVGKQSHGRVMMDQRKIEELMRKNPSNWYKQDPPESDYIWILVGAIVVVLVAIVRELW